jgi:hypothetical protein
MAFPVYHNSPDKMTLMFITWQDQTKAVGSLGAAVVDHEHGALRGADEGLRLDRFAVSASQHRCPHRGKYVPL